VEKVKLEVEGRQGLELVLSLLLLLLLLDEEALLEVLLEGESSLFSKNGDSVVKLFILIIN
jgi:hypothetical protein